MSEITSKMFIHCDKLLIQTFAGKNYLLVGISGPN